jgi:chromate transport protein ChrA
MTTTTIEQGRIGELVRYFLRLGCLGFGGPVALVGQMERELVDGKKWLTKEQMREAIAICQSLPGPLAIQVGIYISPAASGFALSKLLFFLKGGSLTFGSGLVIVPFLEQGLVQQYNWLDERQFLIAVAIGMISPGPVVITATFVGYLVAGFWGSLV